MDNYDITRLVYKICVSCSAVICLLFRYRWKNTFWKWLPFFLLFVAMGEWGGYLLRLYPNHYLSNPDYYSFILHPAIFLFIFSAFKISEPKQAVGQRLFWICTGVFILGCVADYFFLKQKRLWFSSFSYTLGVLLLIILLVRFYTHFLFSDRILTYRRNIIFWLCGSWFVYYAGSFPFFALRNILVDKFPQIFYPYWFVQMILSCIMYLSMMIFYLWAKPK